MLFEKQFVMAIPGNQQASSRPSPHRDGNSDSPKSQRRTNSPKSQRQIDLLTVGIAFVGPDRRVICVNKAFTQLLGRKVSSGALFYDALGESEIEGPDYCPFASVCRTGTSTVTSVRIRERTFELTFSPNRVSDDEQIGFVIEMRDITSSIEVNETLRRLLEIGAELTDLPSHRLAVNNPEDRISLLRMKIENGLRNVLRYEICEIRLLEESSGRLLPFLAFGLSPEAAKRELVASSNDNGITGYVAHNRAHYYCEETLDHPFYLPGNPETRCSLTVPIFWREKVIGTCNVESTKPGTFSEFDFYLLQIFMRDVAAALHTLNLLSYEKIFAINSSMNAVVTSIASPIDTILQNTAILMDSNLDLDPTAIPTLRAIIEKARVIKDQITLVRRRMTATGENSAAADTHPILNRRRILVIDRDPEILQSAHTIFEGCGSIVETAPDALVALKMLRYSHYDAVICEIMPEGGMSGYQFMLRMRDFYPDLQTPPLVLSTGYGYDPNHVLVKANQNGLLGSIFKPFVLPRTLDVLEGVINVCGDRDVNGDLIPPSPLGFEKDGPAPTLGVSLGRNTIRPGGLTRPSSFFDEHEGGRINDWLKQIMASGSDSDRSGASDESLSGEGSGFDAT